MLTPFNGIEKVYATYEIPTRYRRQPVVARVNPGVKFSRVDDIPYQRDVPTTTVVETSEKVDNIKRR